MRGMVIVALAVLAVRMLSPALAADVQVQVTLAPDDFEAKAKLKGSQNVPLRVPQDLIEVAVALEVEGRLDGEPVPEFDYPKIALRANALMTGNYRVTLYGWRGEFRNENWDRLVNDRRVLKFDFQTQEELFAYLGLSTFELRRRTTGLTSGAQLDPKTAQILYHYLRLWIAISQSDDLAIAPLERPYSNAIRLLSEFESAGDRQDQWYRRETGFARSQFNEVVRLARSISANYYQRLYQGILRQESCKVQADLLRRMSASFDALVREEQSRVAANFNSLPGSPAKSPEQWTALIQGDIKDREDRATSGTRCVTP
mgnify:CR=1 FL=1